MPLREHNSFGHLGRKSIITKFIYFCLSFLLSMTELTSALRAWGNLENPLIYTLWLWYHVSTPTDTFMYLIYKEGLWLSLHVVLQSERFKLMLPFKPILCCIFYQGKADELNISLFHLHMFGEILTSLLYLLFFRLNKLIIFLNLKLTFYFLSLLSFPELSKDPLQFFHMLF